MKTKQFISLISISLGVFALLLAAALWLYNDIEETIAAEYSERASQAILYHIKTIPNINNPFIGGNPLTDDNPPEEINSEAVFYINEKAYIGILSIPRLELDLPVAGEWNYEELKNTPCRYSGSIADNNMVIAAHNYKKHFANIRRLKRSDLILFTDVNGVEITYRVAGVKTVQPSAVEEVTDSGFDLTLFTCTYDRSARVVVYADREDKEII